MENNLLNKKRERKKNTNLTKDNHEEYLKVYYEQSLKENNNINSYSTSCCSLKDIDIKKIANYQEKELNFDMFQNPTTYLSSLETKENSPIFPSLKCETKENNNKEELNNNKNIKKNGNITSKKINFKSIEEYTDKIIPKYKKLNKEKKEKILEEGIDKWNYDLNIFLLIIISLLNDYFNKYNNYVNDYTFYIYNDLKALKMCNKDKNIFIENIPTNEVFYKECIKFYEMRHDYFINIAKKYKIKNLEFYESENQNNNTNDNCMNNSNMNSNNNNNISDKVSPNFYLLKEEFKWELITAGLIDSILKRNEKEEKLKDKNDKKDIIPVCFDVSNFNISEESFMGVISGIIFNKNIIEINLSGNKLAPKCCFWLGNIVKTNPNVRVLDLTRCNIDNYCLYTLIEGTKFGTEHLNSEQYNLEKINLKDNIITDTENNDFEHPIGLLLRVFKLKFLNLTNAKMGNSGVCKFLTVYLNLMKENKIFMENLILIGNNFGNQECLDLLGDIITQKGSTLKSLVLSKNLISTFPSSCPEITPGQETTPCQDTQNCQNKNNSYNQENTNNINYFEKFMNKLGDSNLEELFLINCGIGKTQKEVDILYDMLCKNKSLITLRLFGNNISSMSNFQKILGIFSEYNNNLKNNSLKSLDLSKNSCNLEITEEFLNIIEKLKLEYLDINQNVMQADEKEVFRKKTNELTNIKIIY